MLTDLHQHLVYGVDDGPAELAASLELLRGAVSQGVGSIVCTAHDAPGTQRMDRMRYERHLAALRQAAAEEELPVMLHSGSELLFSADALTMLRSGETITLAGTRQVLVEFYPDMPWQLMDAAAEAIAALGYRMVLAHAERYQCLTDLNRLAMLRREYDAAIQVNADTILQSGRLLNGRWAREALQAGLVDIAASDAHGPQRPCRLSRCYDMLRKRYGEATAQRLCVKTPAALITE